MSRSLHSCVLRIWSQVTQDKVVGTGFLVPGLDGRSYAITCAHVVNVALGRQNNRAQEEPQNLELYVERADSSGRRLKACLEHWVPPEGEVAPKTAGSQKVSLIADIAVFSVEINHDPSWPDLRVVPSRRVLPLGVEKEFFSFGFMGPDSGTSTRGILTSVGFDGWFVAKAKEGHGWFIEQGLSGAPIFADGVILGMVAERFGGSSAQGRVIPAMTLAQAWPVLTNPYIGLASFESETEHLFFGRGIPVGLLRGRLNNARVVMVLGASGSGKSSLVQAGLAPGLEREGWHTISFRPGGDPLSRLAQAVADTVDPRPPGLDRLKLAEEWEEQLERSGLDGALKMLRAKQARGILIIVDQFEEFFDADRQSEAELARQRDLVLSMLAEAVRFAQDVRLVLTLRADLLGRVTADTRANMMLADPFPPFVLPRMTPAELGCAIRGAASLFNVDVDDSLVLDFAADAAREEGRLPLLQAALQECWTKIVRVDKRWRLVRPDFDRKEGRSNDGVNLEAALTRRANDAMDALAKALPGPAIHEDEIQRVLTGMVRLSGPDKVATKRIVDGPLEGEAPSHDWEVIKRLANERIVVLGSVRGRPTAELAHEALITHWEKLATWVAADREFIVWLDRFERQQQLWDEHGRGNDHLLRRSDVADAWDWLTGPRAKRMPPNSIQAEFIRKSRDFRLAEQEEKSRAKALQYGRDVEQATNALLHLDNTLDHVCASVEQASDFQFVAVQLKDKESQTIQTVWARGLKDGWYGIARHTYQGDSALWDIQAHVVAADPPRIEILSGWDDRFDRFIFQKFNHPQVTRAFAPIILGRNGFEALLWSKTDERPLNRLLQTPHDRRTVLELGEPDLAAFRQSRSEVIGTVEAGYYSPTAQISTENAKKLAKIAGQHALELWCASLDHVFEVIAKSARDMVRADVASLHFSFDVQRQQYAYEARDGTHFRSVLTPRRSGLGTQALEESRASKKRVSKYVPDLTQGHDEEYFQKFFPEAYAEGIRAEAAIPILFSQERPLYSSAPDEDSPPPREGLLYVRFTQTRWLTKDQIAWVEYFADRATDAIRQVGYYTNVREGARRLANLHHIAQSLADNPTARNLLADIAGNVMNIFGADLVTVYEVDTRKDTMTEPWSAGRFCADERTTKASLHKNSAPRLLLKEGRNIFRADAKSCPILCSPGHRDEALGPRFLDREKVVSAAGVILRIRSDVIGLMFVNYRIRHYFPAEERRFIEALASAAAVAIRNRRLLERIAHLEKDGEHGVE